MPVDSRSCLLDYVISEDYRPSEARNIVSTAQQNKRRLINTRDTPFQPYDLDGPQQPEMAMLPLSYDQTSGRGSYLVRMQPGATTIEHAHHYMEEFMVLEGYLTDSDGTILGPGDYVVFEPGTRHNSWTETGCLILVFEWQKSP